MGVATKTFQLVQGLKPEILEGAVGAMYGLRLVIRESSTGLFEVTPLSHQAATALA
jgi:hypothetical protein